jgi:hypothetical protein
MGGDGSGEWTRWNAKGAVECRRSLDVRIWQRGELLQAGNLFSWSFNENDSIMVQVELGQVRLKYSLQPSGQEKQSVDELVRLSSTSCNYGGQRGWFVCPSHSCGRRVAVLYLGSKYFICRRCCGLAYTSQREDRKYRALRRLLKIRKRLGATGPVDSPLPQKPKRMRQTTHARLKQKVEQAECELQEAETEWYSGR